MRKCEFELLYINNGSGERGAFPCRLRIPLRRIDKSAERRNGRRESELGSAACCTIVNTLHISRSIRGPSNLSTTTFPTIFCLPLIYTYNIHALYSTGLQLAKIDRVKVHDGADHRPSLVYFWRRTIPTALLHYTFRTTFHYNNVQLLAVPNVIYVALYFDLHSRFIIAVVLMIVYTRHIQRYIKLWQEIFRNLYIYIWTSAPLRMKNEIRDWWINMNTF